MYFTGAMGIWCSVRSVNSWRSLLATLLSIAQLFVLRLGMIGWPAGLVLLGMTRPVGFRGMAFVVFSFVAFSQCLTLAMLLAEAEIDLREAEQWIVQHARVRPRGEMAGRGELVRQ